MGALIESSVLAGWALPVGLWCYGAAISIDVVRKGRIFAGVVVPAVIAGAGSVAATYLAVNGKELWALPVAGLAFVLLWLFGEVAKASGIRDTLSQAE